MTCNADFRGSKNPNADQITTMLLPGDGVGNLVSVIIPTFNRADMTIELLDNLVTQSWRSLEIIVIDDGATDRTAERVRQWATDNNDSGLTVTLLQQANGGPSAARNHGLQIARGEFIYFIDSDDLTYPFAFATMVAAIRQSRCAYALAPVWIADEVGTPDLSNREGWPRQHPDNPLLSDWMTHCALYTRQSIRRAGSYHADLTIGEDTEFHWRIVVMNGAAAMLATPVGVRREHSAGHLSVGRSHVEVANDDIIATRRFIDWAKSGQHLAPHMATNIAFRGLISAIKLGYAGEWPAKQRALALIEHSGVAHYHWSRLAAAAIRPNSRLWFAPWRVALWLARYFRQVTLMIKPVGTSDPAQP